MQRNGQSPAENTYVFFWTDNGTHNGDHRLSYGKRTPYEQDINFPLVVRGPGIQQGTSEKLVGNHDIAPTIADLADVDAPEFVDGRSIVPLFEGEPAQWREALLSESALGFKAGAPPWNALRTEDGTYVEDQSGERELYDLSADPYQTDNLLSPGGSGDARNLPARLETLKGCGAEKTTTCAEAEGM